MDTFCSQAFGGGQHRLLGTILQRALLINLAACLPPILLWTITGRQLLWWAEDKHMAAAAMQYARLWSPVLVLHGSSPFVHRYLVAQGMVTWAWPGAEQSFLVFTHRITQTWMQVSV